MIQNFIYSAIANRRSLLDLPERDVAHDHDLEALDRFDEQDLNVRDKLKGQRAPTAADLEKDDQAELSESSVIEADAPDATTPAWRAFKIALLILCINLAASALVAVVVFKPSLALLGFFVEFCVMSLTGLPMLLATVSEAAEKH